MAKISEKKLKIIYDFTNLSFILNRIFTQTYLQVEYIVIYFMVI